MKGPFERLKYDLRRLWECPQCKRRERTAGGVTAKFCTCGGGESGLVRHGMRLIEEAGHRTTPPIVLVHPPLEPLAPAANLEIEPELPAQRREPLSEAASQQISPEMLATENPATEELATDEPATDPAPTDSTTDTGSA